ncbi:MAG: hypothetical protein GY820_17180, partial [Gammaproteobacteria bacterium]|nr:hypothetical protein [Gammaproteobacteria bacterium]
MNMYSKICNKVRSLIKFSKAVSVDDAGDYRFGTISAVGKQQKANFFTPYGLIHNPPVNSLCLSFLSRGEESNTFVIADDPINRIKGLESGEVGIANYSTGTHFVMKANGDWDIQVNGNVNLTVTGDVTANVSGEMDAQVTGDVTVASGGNMELGAASGYIHLDTPLITWAGGSIDSNGITVNNG